MSGYIHIRDAGGTTVGSFVTTGSAATYVATLHGHGYTIQYQPDMYPSPPSIQSVSVLELPQVIGTLDTLSTRLLDLITVLRDDADYWRIKAAEWEAEAKRLSETVAAAA